MSSSHQPMYCPRCKFEGAYVGALWFPNSPKPVCKVHNQEMVPVERKK